jgi:glycerol uptake facilitator-like aquaporin
MNPRAIIGELLGTALLLAVVIGSGIMGEKLALGNTAVALLANAVATGCGLAVLIALLGPLSGAHFNPVVTIAARLHGEITTISLIAYLLAQFLGAVLGVWLAHLMFDLAIVQSSAKLRTGTGQWTGEIVATFGLVFLIRLGLAQRLQNLGAYVALYITAAYWFTSSTSFANPAVTVARSMSDTFAGIHPNSVAGFVVAQCIGAALGIAAARALTEAEAKRR